MASSDTTAATRVDNAASNSGAGNAKNMTAAETAAEPPSVAVASTAAIQGLMNLGFSEAQVRHALTECNGDADAAAEFLFATM